MDFTTTHDNADYAFESHRIRRDTTLRTKRLLDIGLCLLALPFALPILAFAAILVILDGGPAFFGHTRIGKGGKKFQCWKLRTMIMDADAVLDAYLSINPKAQAEWDKKQKLKKDPRITWIGRFLRKSSIDELPQIWNVLKGEMSLVGPRPIVEEELSRYGGFRYHYLDMLPGITGLWQISGRNQVDYDDRVRLDATYHRNYSILQDLKILLSSVVVVLNMTGE